MISDRDIWAAALLIVQRYDEGARHGQSRLKKVEGPGYRRTRPFAPRGPGEGIRSAVRSPSTLPTQIAAGGRCPGVTGSLGDLCFEPMSPAAAVYFYCCAADQLVEDGNMAGERSRGTASLKAIERLRAQKPAEGERGALAASRRRTIARWTAKTG
jgi:hypothetical protein